jgi:hypothetical protein
LSRNAPSAQSIIIALRVQIAGLLIHAPVATTAAEAPHILLYALQENIVGRKE